MKASLVLRAVVAVVLMVGFYALAIGMAAAILWLVYAQFAYANRFSPKLTIFGLLGAFAILAAIVPRPDRFEPPGPELTRDQHPKLFAMIDEVSDQTGQARPAEVYLVNDMNAFVTQRGGVMGFFSKRVMGLGLPLMQVLSVSQLKAVLAHEFGHFHGGDVQVGPWIYKTRGAIGRTIMSLGDSIIQKPFEWYGSLFLRITQAISRHQEYAADALAARVVGSKHLIEGLKVVHGGALAFNAYWESEYIPAIAAGFRPPLARGFKSFMNNDRLSDALEKAVSEALEHDEHDPYDTHPPLRRRIEALEALGLDGDNGSDDRRAITMLGARKRVEKELLASIVVDSHFATLKELDWADVPERIYLPKWQERAAKDARAFSSMSPRKIPTNVKGMVKLSARLFAGEVSPDELRAIDDETLARAVADRLATTFAVALVRRGWAVHGEVGEPFRFEKDGHRLEVFRQLHELIAGELSADDWHAALDEAGVARMRLVPKDQAEDAA